MGDIIPEKIGQLPSELLSFTEWSNSADFSAEKKRQRLLRESTNKNLADAIVAPAVKLALRDAASLLGDEPVAVIGGLALGAYVTPRYTEDVDLILAAGDVERVANKLSPSFKRISPHAFEHKKVGVLVELVDPDLIGIDPELAAAALRDAKRHQVGTSSIGVVSLPYLVALKLGRAASNNHRKYIDRGDIVALLAAHGDQDLSGIPLKDAERELYAQLAKEALPHATTSGGTVAV